MGLAALSFRTLAQRRFPRRTTPTADYLGASQRKPASVNIRAKDPARALHWYIKAASAGDSYAALQAAHMTENGEAGAADAQEAVVLFLLASSGGQSEATAHAARLILHGDVEPPPGVDAEAMAVAADEAGYPDGIVVLLNNLWKGKNGSTKDLKRAGTLAQAAYARALARTLDEEGGWPLYTRRIAIVLQAAIRSGAIEGQPGQLEELGRIWGTEDRMKKFTVPFDFGGIKAPFDVYTWDAPDGPVPTDAQFDWVAKVRGGKVPEEVRVSFQKLFKLAKDNNVSFSDLCVYAMEVANKDNATKTKEPAK